MNDKDIKVLGTLKKEKSSKPLFVIFVFILVIGFCFGLPYIKAYFGEDFSLENLLNKPSTNDSSNTTTTSTTTTTTTPVALTLTCTLKNSEYIFTFENEKLTQLSHKYTYQKEDENTYLAMLNEFTNRGNNVKNLGGNNIVTEDENGFVYETTYTTNGAFNTIDSNYYIIGEKQSTIKREITAKGFDCQ